MSEPAYIGQSEDGLLVVVTIGRERSEMTPAVARNMAAILVNEACAVSENRERRVMPRTAEEIEEARTLTGDKSAYISWLLKDGVELGARFFDPSDTENLATIMKAAFLAGWAAREKAG